jgi:hypothetical protein
MASVLHPSKSEGGSWDRWGGPAPHLCGLCAARARSTALDARLSFRRPEGRGQAGKQETSSVKPAIAAPFGGAPNESSYAIANKQRPAWAQHEPSTSRPGAPPAQLAALLVAAACPTCGKPTTLECEGSRFPLRQVYKYEKLTSETTLAARNSWICCGLQLPSSSRKGLMASIGGKSCHTATIRNS